MCFGIILGEGLCFPGDTEMGCSGGQIYDGLSDSCETAGPQHCAEGFTWNGTSCTLGEEDPPPICESNVRHIITGQCFEIIDPF
jgi:hypothetical protein